MSSIRAQAPFLEPVHGLLLKMDDLDEEVHEKTSINIPEEVFPGREEEEEEDTGSNIWRRRGRLMNNKLDEEV